LVIDEALGKSCVTYSAISAFDDLDATIDNLRDREGMPNAVGVGFTVANRRRQSARALERHPNAVELITTWVNANGLDAAIWTALGSNFAAKTNEPFSVETAIRYLETRDDRIRDAALAYIRRAPQEVQTPLREAVNIQWPDASGKL
jgi:hypothetical protein